MNAHEIKNAVASYWRYNRQCLLVCFERGIHDLHVPDVLVVTEDRRLIEVEVKISLADFRADAKKLKWARTLHNKTKRTFYFAVPFDLVPAVLKEARAGAGVLSVSGRSGQNVTIARKAEVIRDRVSMRDLWIMVRNQTGTLISMSEAVGNWIEREREWNEEKRRRLGA